MYTVTKDQQGPGRDPFEPLVDEFTCKLNETSAAEFLNYFDPAAELFLSIEASDIKRAPFGPHRLTYDISRDDIAEQFIARIQKRKTEKFEFLSKGDNKEADFNNYFTILENLPWFCQKMDQAGVGAEFYTYTVSMMSKLISQGYVFSPEKLASLAICLGLKILDVERILLKCASEVDEVQESKRVLCSAFSHIKVLLEQAQSSGTLSAESYRKIEVTLEDIPIWKSAYGQAAVEVCKSEQDVFGSAEKMITGVLSLLNIKAQNFKDNPEKDRRNLDDELYFKQVAEKLAQQNEWDQPIEGLKKCIQGHSLVYIEFRLSSEDLELESNVIKTLNPKPGDLFVLNIPDLTEAILSLNRLEGTPIEPKEAHNQIVEYLSLLKKNPSLRSFHSIISPSKAISQLSPFSSFDRVVNALRSRNVDVLVLPVYDNFLSHKNSTHDKSTFVSLSGLSKRIFLLNYSISYELPVVFSGTDEEIIRIGIRSLVKHDHEAHTLSGAIAERAKRLPCIGISNSSLIEHAGEDRHIISDFSVRSGNWCGELYLSNNQVSRPPPYAADYYVFYTHDDGPDDDDGESLDPVTSDSDLLKI